MFKISRTQLAAASGITALAVLASAGTVVMTSSSSSSSRELPPASGPVVGQSVPVQPVYVNAGTAKRVKAPKKVKA